MALEVVCLWPGCPAPGPYDGPRALGEHMDVWHCAADAAGAGFRCQWPECAYEAVGGSAEQWAGHVRRHSGHRPHACAAPGCTAAFALPHALHRHRRTAHADGARCEWQGCAAPHARDAAALLAHLLAAHRPGLTQNARCGWQGCAHAFAQRDYRRHLEGLCRPRKFRCAHPKTVHCPDLYICKTCSRGFRSQAAMKNHARKHSAAAAEQDPESETERLDNAPTRSHAARKKHNRNEDRDDPPAKRHRDPSILEEDEVELAVTERISPTAVPPVERQGENEVIVIDDSDDEIQSFLDQEESEATTCDDARPAFETRAGSPGGKEITATECSREGLLRVRLLASTRVPERGTQMALRWGDGDEHDWEYCT